MRLLLPSMSFVLVALAHAQAPPGYKTWENKQAKLTFFYPVAYQEMPVPPTEQVVVARYVLQKRPEELKKIDDRLYKMVEPHLEVFCFEVQAAVTGAGATTNEPAAPSTVKQAMEAGSKVSSWDEFTQRFARWNLVENPKKPGHFELQWKGQQLPTNPIGYLVRKQEGASTFGVYGVSLEPHKKAFEAHVTKMAGSITLADADAGEMAEAAIDRLYASGDFRAVEWRKKTRAELARGWKAVDTANYLIVHHSKNEGLIRQIAREIEAMRTLYVELFPTTTPVESVSVVRVCRTRDEYRQYGGPPGTGGYWHPGNEELVFYDYSYTMKTLDEDEKKAMGGRVLTNDDSLLVLYHEAFHQYIHYAIGEFAPHDWFNEGYGDYFSGAVFADSSSRVVRIDPSPWRIHLAKDQCEHGEGFIPLNQLLRAERVDFYHPSRIGQHYAAAWSFVFFLKNSKEVAAHPRWSKLLQDYLDQVKAAYRAEIEKIEGTADLEQKQKAGFMARRTAINALLEGLELEALEAAWRKWVVDMKDPWPSKRKKHK